MDSSDKIFKKNILNIDNSLVKVFNGFIGVFTIIIIVFLFFINLCIFVVVIIIIIYEFFNCFLLLYVFTSLFFIQ
jgi:hypothetical protein